MSPTGRVLELPYPPSVNHIWRRVGSRTIMSREGRRYRNDVCAALAAMRVARMDGRLAVRVIVCPPDGRRRDLDNVQKSLLDALAHGGAYRDDSQIDRLVVDRGPVTPGGKVLVEITQIRPSPRACWGRSTEKQYEQPRSRNAE